MKVLLPMRNAIKNYGWGHPSRINEMLGLGAGDGKPQAELWMGAHPGGPSLVEIDGVWTPLDRAIGDSPDTFLGAWNGNGTVREFPFLLKVLAADKALSIQCHPNLESARRGFAAEEAAGLPRDAETRNYKDANHKPELISALEDFWALAGFRPLRAIIADFEFLSEESEAGSVSGKFYRSILTLLGPSPEKLESEKYKELVRRILTLGPEGPGIAEDVVRIARKRLDDRFARLVLASPGFPGDPSLLFFLILNLRKLKAGEAMFIPAGVLHAYVKGFGVEIMASSDNVLRGGLTPKHIDIHELMKNLDPASHETLLDGAEQSAVKTYPEMCREFRLTRLDSQGSRVSCGLGGEGMPRIVLCTGGSARVSSGDEVRELGQGESLLVLPAAARVTVDFEGLVFVAGVPNGPDLPEEGCQ